MLSRIDIENELGKGINIYPLKLNNFKENSINLTVSQNAWASCDGTVYWYENDKLSFTPNGDYKKKIDIKKGCSCILDANGKRKLMILLPHSTTIVETSEVIAVASNIGGALHSKVGVVAKGIGHIGTMLGPGYCGHLMISLHNITDGIIVLPVGSTFVSLTFDYLISEVPRTSATTSGHVDKFSELGIKVDETTTTFLTEDWKSTLDGVRDKMTNSDEYIGLQERKKQNRIKKLKEMINKNIVISIIVVIVVFIILYLLAKYADTKCGVPVWVDRFWNVGCSGLICSVLLGIINSINNKSS